MTEPIQLPPESLDELHAEAITALKAALAAEVVKRVEVTCTKCGHANRKTVRIPAPRERLDVLPTEVVNAGDWGSASE
jgi:hypothetical protein